MSREILFRGKRVDNGSWETGSLVISRMGTSEAKTYIADKMTAYHTPVIPKTVGQYTGLKDKNGKKIFEGDIVRLQNLKLLYEIYWDKKEARYKARNGGCVSPLCNDYNVFVEEAVGNVFDNPELLEGEK